MLKPAIVRPSDIVPPVEILPVGKAGEVVVRVKGAVNGLVNVSSVSETNDGQDDKFNPEKTKQLITENYHGEETLLMGRSRPFDNLGTKIISETGNRGFIVVPTAS
ncbi:MAG TPA: hypothetical protein PK765_06600 [bacterium]|nr:hypothetical protein [bacterium]